MLGSEMTVEIITLQVILPTGCTSTYISILELRGNGSNHFSLSCSSTSPPSTLSLLPLSKSFGHFTGRFWHSVTPPTCKFTIFEQNFSSA